MMNCDCVRLSARVGCLILIFILVYPALYSPSDKPTTEVLCHKHMRVIARRLSRAGDFDYTSSSCLRGRIAKVCLSDQDSNHSLYSVRRLADEDMLLDPWGTPYNMCLTNETFNFEGLSFSAVSNIIIWSSGANKINEYGRGDDVVLRRW